MIQEKTLSQVIDRLEALEDEVKVMKAKLPSLSLKSTILSLSSAWMDRRFGVG